MPQIGHIFKCLQPLWAPFFVLNHHLFYFPYDFEKYNVLFLREVNVSIDSNLKYLTKIFFLK